MAKKKKVSALKLANKKNTKLLTKNKAKKLKDLRLRKERKSARGTALKSKGQKQNTKSPNFKNSKENGIAHNEDDGINFYQNGSKYLSFAGLPETVNKPAKKRKRPVDEDSDDMEEFEEMPRKISNSNANMKMLLPIKGVTGKIIKRMVEKEDIESENESDENEGYHKEAEEESTEMDYEKALSTMTPVELFARRRRLLAEKKKSIALFATHILENPEENIARLQDLRLMLNERDPELYVTVRKLVIVSLMEVFRDIIPMYKIRLMTEQEKAPKLKKETKVLEEYERSLLQNYKLYLEHLEFSIKGQAPKTRKMPLLDIPKAVAQKIAELACKCMCGLLSNHSHFNYTANIITVLVPLMRRGTVMSDSVIQCIKHVFRTDKSGHVSLEIVRSITRMIKACNFSVKPKVLETFMSLKIKEVDMTTAGDTKQTERRNEKLELMSKRERKRKKAIDKINHELLEVQATEDRNKKLKLHTDIIQAVFVTYFRILKTTTRSSLLPSVLEGLARFAHLINVEFFDDLFKVFDGLLSSSETTYREKLHCVQTAFTILSGQGSSLTIDPINFYRHMYNTLFLIHAGSSQKDLPIVLKCMRLMFHMRRKKVSQQRVLAYVKRLTSMTLLQLPHAMLALLSATRALLNTFSYVDRLYDNEMSGSGIYHPELVDPEHCNAHNTAIWETSLLRHHFHPVVCKYATHICRQAPSTGDGQLPHQLSRTSPEELYHQHDFSTKVIGDDLPHKSLKKLKFHEKGFNQVEFSDYVMKVLQSVPDCITEENTAP